MMSDRELKPFRIGYDVDKTEATGETKMDFNDSRSNNFIEDNLDTKERYLLGMLNDLIKIRPITYGELSNIIPFIGKTSELSEFEKKYPEIGLAVIIDNDDSDIPVKNRVIQGFQFVEYDDKCE